MGQQRRWTVCKSLSSYPLDTGRQEEQDSRRNYSPLPRTRHAPASSGAFAPFPSRVRSSIESERPSRAYTHRERTSIRSLVNNAVRRKTEGHASPRRVHRLLIFCFGQKSHRAERDSTSVAKVFSHHLYHCFIRPIASAPSSLSSAELRARLVRPRTSERKFHLRVTPPPAYANIWLWLCAISPCQRALHVSQRRNPSTQQTEHRLQPRRAWPSSSK